MLYSKSLKPLLQLAALGDLFGLTISSADREGNKSKSEFTQRGGQYFCGLFPFFFFKLPSLLFSTNNWKYKICIFTIAAEGSTYLWLISLHTADAFWSSMWVSIAGPSPCPVRIATNLIPSPTLLVGVIWLGKAPGARSFHPLFCITLKDMENQRGQVALGSRRRTQHHGRSLTQQVEVWIVQYILCGTERRISLL